MSKRYGSHHSQHLRKWITELIDNCRLTREDAQTIGTIVASPSKDSPNYYYEWTRDAALTMQCLLDLVISKEIDYFGAGRDSGVKDIFDNYVLNQWHLQNVCIEARVPLGEPKFNPDNTLFQEEWGRPQNDGPALRAIFLIRYAFYLLEIDRTANYNYVAKLLYDSKYPSSHSIIKRDLEYVCATHLDPCYDLWEELYGFHFYTLMVQAKSLELGVQIAKYMGDTEAAEFYKRVAHEIREVIHKRFYVHVNKNKKDPDPATASHIVSSIDVSKMPQSIGIRKHDMSIVLAFLHTNQALDLPALKTVVDMIAVFRREYPINSTLRSVNALLVGRYPKDEYYGGNPWVLTSAAFVCAIHTIDTSDPSAAGIKNKISQTVDIEQIMSTIITFEAHNNDKDPEMSYAEQINADNMMYLSANKLSWNYVELIRAALALKKEHN